MTTEEENELEDPNEESEGEEEEEEEEDEEEARLAAEAAEKEKARASAAAPKKKRKKKKHEYQGIGAPPPDGYRNKEAVEMWPLMLEELVTLDRSPEDLVVRVTRVSPPPTQTLQPPFDAINIVGDPSMPPGECLLDFITREYHEPRARGEATYQIAWVWKANGQIWRSGKLRCESPEVLRYGAPPRRRYAEPYAPRGFGSPYSRYREPPYEPQYEDPGRYDRGGYERPPPRYAGYGAPPGREQGPSERERYLEAQVGHLSGQLKVLIGALEKQGVQVPAGVAAPPPPPPPPAAAAPPSEDPEERMVRALIKYGVVPGAAAAGTGVGAAPKTGLGAVLDHAKTSAGTFMELTSVYRDMKKAQRIFKQIASDEDDDAEVGSPQIIVEPPKTPEDPSKDLPWKGIVVEGANWPDGSNIIFPAKKPKIKPDGSVEEPSNWPDVVGIGMANPYLLGQIGAPVAELVQAFAEFVKSKANVAMGVGAAAEKEEEKPPNGAAQSGWAPQT